MHVEIRTTGDPRPDGDGQAPSASRRLRARRRMGGVRRHGRRVGHQAQSREPDRALRPSSSRPTCSPPRAWATCSRRRERPPTSVSAPRCGRSRSRKRRPAGRAVRLHPDGARPAGASSAEGELRPRRGRRGAAGRRALVELAREGDRREWTFGEVAERSARLAGTLARARRRPRRRRHDADRQPPGMGARDGRVLPPRRRRAALHRAAASQGPAGCAWTRSPAARWCRRRAQPRASSRPAARLDGAACSRPRRGAVRRASRRGASSCAPTTRA